jgi:hypothetical protein
MRNLDAQTKAALLEDTKNWAIFIRFDFDSGTLALSSATKNIVHNGVTYIGASSLKEIPAIQEDMDAQPKEYEVMISGIDTNVLSLYLNEQYMMRPAKLEYALLDNNQDIIGIVAEVKGGIQSISLTEGKSPELKIMFSSKLTDWNRPRRARYTNEDHQRFLFENGYNQIDKAFEFVQQLENREIIFPNKKWFEKNA